MCGTHSTAERFPTRRNRTCLFDKTLASIVVNPCAIIVFFLVLTSVNPRA